MSGIPTPPHQKPTVAKEKAPGPDERGTPTGMSPEDRDAFIKARKKRNIAIALGLISFSALIFIITALRLAQNIAAGQAG